MLDKNSEILLVHQPTGELSRMTLARFALAIKGGLPVEEYLMFSGDEEDEAKAYSNLWNLRYRARKEIDQMSGLCLQKFLRSRGYEVNPLMSVATDS